MEERLGDVNGALAPSEDELRGVCEDLLRSWASELSDRESIELGTKDQPVDPQRFSVVFAFVAHTHHITTTAADLMHADDYASAVPLLRVGYESALTATWAAHSREAARALQNHYVEQAKKLLDNATRTGWFDNLSIDPEAAETVDVAPSAKGEAASFVNLCLALEPHGEWLYTMYRLLSGYAHPSATVLAMYTPIEVDSAFSLFPRPIDDRRMWWHAAATNLLHAGQALDRLDPSARRRQALAGAAETIGWPEPLKLTDAAASKLMEALAG